MTQDVVHDFRLQCLRANLRYWPYYYWPLMLGDARFAEWKDILLTWRGKPCSDQQPK